MGESIVMQMEARVIYMNEDYILEGCRRNDRNCQRQLYEKYFSPMAWVCYRYVKDQQTAEDLVHEGFIKVFKKIGSFRDNGSLEGWIRRIMINCCLDHLRKGKRRPDEVSIQAVADQDSGTADALDDLQAEYILEKVQELPEIPRTVFNLNIVEGYPHKEIAAMMNIKESTSRAYLTEARQLLRKALQKSIIQTERRMYNG